MIFLNYVFRIVEKVRLGFKERFLSTSIKISKSTYKFKNSYKEVKSRTGGPGGGVRQLSQKVSLIIWMVPEAKNESFSRLCLLLIVRKMSIDTRAATLGQFHQHVYSQPLCAQITKVQKRQSSKLLEVIGVFLRFWKINAQKMLIKCWWNCHLFSSLNQRLISTFGQFNEKTCNYYHVNCN